VSRVRAFESGLLTLMRTKNAGLLDSIRKSGDLSKDDEAKLKDIVDGYAKSFT
jgi:F-type H+-transporting ATPase subunit alpha